VVRSDGHAELVGDIVIVCTGGTPTGSTQIVPAVNLTVFLNAPVTSRLLSGTFMEAFVIVDEPAAASQAACTTPSGVCSLSGTGTGIGTYNGTTGRPNIFQGQTPPSAGPSSGNSVAFIGLPFDPPGPNRQRTFRITNLRASALSVGTPSANTPVQIVAAVSISGSTSVPLNNPQQVVAFSQVPYSLSTKNVQSGTNVIAQFTVTLTESFATVFKTRTAAAYAGQNTSPAPVNENTPGNVNPGSETGFYNSSLPTVSGRGNLGTAGLADQGTRVQLRVSQIPSGVSITAPLTANLMQGSNNTGIARLISTDANGAGAFAVASGSVPIVNGVATMVYEILQTNANAIESMDVPLVVGYSAGGYLGSLNIASALAPVSTIAVASLTAPRPRFNNSQNTNISLQSGPPVITTTAITSGRLNSAYSFQMLASGGAPPLAWSATGLPAGLSMNSSGLISGTPTALGTSTITVTVRDAQERSDTGRFTLTIGSTLAVTSPLPSGTVGVAYSQKLEATGGVAPYTFAAAPGSPFNPNSLPAGLSLASDGTLSGTPTTAGNYTFVVNVTDAAQGQGSSSVMMTVNPPFTITTTTLAQGTVGVAYSQAIQASGGTTPYAFTVIGALPPGLTLSPAGVVSGTPTSAGTSTFNIRATDANGLVANRAFDLTIGIVPAVLTASPTQLAFTALQGGDAPAPQTVTIIAVGATPVNFTVLVDGGTDGSPAPSWGRLRLSSGTTPARLGVFIDQGTLQPGEYKARIRIIPQGQPAVNIDVTLTVIAKDPQLDAAPTFLRFGARVAAPGTQHQTIVVRNAGGGGRIAYTAAVVRGSRWITGLSTVPDSAGPNIPSLLNVRIDSAGLGIGAYNDIVRLTWSGGVIDIPVSLFVVGSGPILSLNVTGRRFFGREGQGIANTGNVNVINLGDPSSTINWRAELVRGGTEWLTVSTPTGTSTPGRPGTVTVLPNSNVPNLRAGSRYALVRVSDPAALNSPQYFVVVLDIATADTPPQPNPSPSGLFFTATAANPRPATQNISLFTNSTAPVPFTAAASTDDGANWLSVSPASGTSVTQTPGAVTVSVNATGLRAGIYTGDVSFAMSGQLRVTNITLVVTPAAAAGTSAKVKETPGVCTPSQMALLQTGTQNNFSLPAGWPATLVVRAVNDCGEAVMDASVVASFSNGDPPLSLSSDRTSGTYSATWQPTFPAPQMTVTMRGTAANLSAATMQLTGTVGINLTNPPSQAANGVLHNYNAVIGGSLAPNTIAQIYGTGLAQRAVFPGVIPLRTDFEGTNVLIGPLPAPIYYVSPNQLVVLVPAELQTNRMYPVVIESQGALTPPELLFISPVQPGMAAFVDGRIIAQHSADFTLVTPQSPAKPGETLIIYLSGLGPTNPPVASGEVSPSNPLAVVSTPVKVTVDGQDAQVGFAGLTPFLVGLYQINFTVPSNARAGELDVVVSQGTAFGNTTKLPVQP
jgi:uncharacterized protein (TIGR03437 family)